MSEPLALASFACTADSCGDRSQLDCDSYLVAWTFASARPAGTTRPGPARGTACSIPRAAARLRRARVLRGALRHGRGELDVLPDARSRPMSRGVAAPHAVVVPLRRQAVPEVHAPRHVPRARRRRSDWDLSRGDLDLFRVGHRSDRRGRPARGGARCSFRRASTPRPTTRDYLDWLLGGLAAYPLAVELRHQVVERRRGRTRGSCSPRHRAAWVLIDEPKFESSDPPATSTLVVDPPKRPIAYLRLHGRNAAAWWEHEDAEDRYNYLYSPDELAPFARARASARRRPTQGADVPEQSLLGEGRRERRDAEARPRAD